MAHIIGLDIGTTNTKSIIYDSDSGQIVKIITRPTPTLHPKNGWCEHDPEQIWQTILECISSCAKEYSITSIGVSSMAEAGLPIDAEGDPLYPIIAWYDQRCMEEVAWWESKFTNEALHAITGQRVNPSFGANKILWLKKTFPDVMKKMWKWLSLPDYVLWRLTGELATDYSIASRTLLFDQKTLNWSSEMLEHAQLEKEQLPSTYWGGTFVGYIKPDVAIATGLKEKTKCVLGGQDHLCATVAAGTYKPGQVSDSSGTSEAVICITEKFFTGKTMADKAYASYAHVLPGCYVIKAGMKSSGSAIDWLVKKIFQGEMSLSEDMLNKLLSQAERDCGVRIGPFWLPHWLGAGSPESDRFSRAALIGIRLEHEPKDLLRGMLESLAFWLKQNVDQLEQIINSQITDIRLLGGTSSIHLLSVLKANTLGKSIGIPEINETAALGAALLAGIGAGEFHDIEDALRSLDYTMHTIHPEEQLTASYDYLFREVYSKIYMSIRDINQVITKATLDKGLLY